jgi:hypothetical protein
VIDAAWAWQKGCHGIPCKISALLQTPKMTWNYCDQSDPPRTKVAGYSHFYIVILGSRIMLK